MGGNEPATDQPPTSLKVTAPSIERTAKASSQASSSQNPSGPMSQNAPEPTKSREESVPSSNPALGPSLDQIQTLLATPNDTSRLVGLTLIHSVLDNSATLRADPEAVRELWSWIPASFVQRLLRAGEVRETKTPSDEAETEEPGDGRRKQAVDRKREAVNMISLAVSVLHTFSNLLEEEVRRKKKLTGMIPALLSSLLYNESETSAVTVKTLATLVSTQEGAAVFLLEADIRALTELAPQYPEALQVLRYVWLQGMTNPSLDRKVLSQKANSGIQDLVASFRSTDAVTLLEFLGDFLRDADPLTFPPSPTWLPMVVAYIKSLVSHRPTAAARSAYTKLAAALLQTFPSSSPALLFTVAPQDEKPFAYLLINLVHVDIRSAMPSLLENMNSEDYASTSQRLTSAFDILSSFIGHLVRSMEEAEQAETENASEDVWFMSPELLLKLRKALTEALSTTAEYLRDRWDASVAGAMGLHPDARTSRTHTEYGSRHTLAWDSIHDPATDDPLILAAMRALSLWLREDAAETLLHEAAGLCDMFMELYHSSATGSQDFRRPVLVALEGLASDPNAREQILQHNGWSILTKDLVCILEATAIHSHIADTQRGVEIVRVLLSIVEHENDASGGSQRTQEAWMDFVTKVAAWSGPDELRPQPLPIREFQVAVYELVASLLSNAPMGMRKRYLHSVEAVRDGAKRLQKVVPRGELSAQVEEVWEVLQSIRQSIL